VSDDRKRIDALRLRAYFATVIGTARAPFGNRRAFNLDQADKPIQLANNSTRDKVLFVTVSRSTFLPAGPPTAIFSQQSSSSVNDFVVALLPLAVFRFVLYPDESLSIQGVAAGFVPTVLAVGTESY